MFTRALLTAVFGLAVTGASFAQPTQTFITDTSDTRSIYQSENIGPMRTLLTRENRFPGLENLELGAFFEHAEYMGDLEQDRYGVYGRYGLWESITFEASVPFVDSDFSGESEHGIGDVVLRLDLLAFQDIFYYPFVIPHVEVSLPTGDDDKGLGSGESTVIVGISVGTKVYDQLTYVLDASYAFNSGYSTSENNDIYMISASVVWDISDRFAVLAEGRVYEENDFNETPYQYHGGLAYCLTPDVQLAVYGGKYREDTFIDNKFDLASVRLSVQF